MPPSSVLMIIDVQPSFAPPAWLVTGISALVGTMPSIATVERHNEERTPFQGQLGWAPGTSDDSLVPADRIFVKHGYLPPPKALEYLVALRPSRVLVCGVQADTCVLAAGFALFDAGLHPTLLADLVAGSSIDRSGDLGAKLWRHHFKHIVTSKDIPLLP
jgi:nicotinamidase-related amidase